MVRRAARTGRRVERILERLEVVESAALPLRPLARGVERGGLTPLRRRLLARFTRLGTHPAAWLAGSGLGRAWGPGPPRPLGHRAVEFAAKVAVCGTAGAGAWGRGALGRPAFTPGPPSGRSGCRCCPCARLWAGRTSPRGPIGRAPTRRSVGRAGRRILLGGPGAARRGGGGFAENQPGKFRCDRRHNSRDGRCLGRLGRFRCPGRLGRVGSPPCCQAEVPPAQADQQYR